VTRSFWYFSNTCSTARVDDMLDGRGCISCLRPRETTAATTGRRATNE
jgi:hypothetical protein